ncbi:MAG: dual specificity protein phosphatase family protein, partial [Bryobacteraceae bacterium]
APSLHLSITVLLWAKYSAHLRGWPRAAIRAWFVLVGLSTLTTYQHHFIDLPTGIWVGLLCLAWMPDAGSPVQFSADRRSVPLASAYAAGSALLGLGAVWFGGWAWWLLWPAGSLLIVVAAYAGGSPELLGKRAGRMDPSMAWLLAPYLGAAWLNSRIWTRGEPAANEIAEGVWLGRFPDRRDRNSYGSVLDLTAEICGSQSGVIRGVPMLDLLAPSAADVETAVRAIAGLSEQRPTLVCCALGYSRSATVIAAWLVDRDRSHTLDAAIALVKQRRPQVRIGETHRARLKEWTSRRIKI